ncbi:LacI family DNA-binding transcriptional regulator [Paenibacillus sp. LHD-38]|uniref:LacI family DNA-binding transcriptional regulator n=1 Tax=Paenibacillus sp. LHD-38 TaxID=3072143 RepID=UPI00280F4310|nr:LacI family DNA-binding transcriptional regulator [Paenibacillus sp. LHD-38]MDQ8738823.1 LacI family DNA-binding transcriptional regulator [Paenibacillus sp. LHD-38]
MKPKVTMQQIADELKLSKNSVSQALSGKDGVSEETRNLVMNKAQELGYNYPKNKKTSIGSQETSKQTGTLALIASDFAFSMRGFFGEIYLSIEKEAKQRGYELLIQSIDRTAIAERKLFPFLQNRSVDGLIILSHITTEYTKMLLRTGIPAVMIDHHHPDLQVDCILTNNRFGSYEAIRHLVELGHRDIGFVGDTQFSPSYQERLDGYRMAMQAFGLAVKEMWVCSRAVEDSTFIHEYTKSLESQPTAWFCVNDGLGFFITSSVQQLGMKVPEEVSIVSFDNGYLSQISTPPSTTIDVDLKLFAAKAVERLMERINDPIQPYTELHLPTKLVVRESTGRPRD